MSEIVFAKNKNVFGVLLGPIKLGNFSCKLMCKDKDFGVTLKIPVLEQVSLRCCFSFSHFSVNVAQVGRRKAVIRDQGQLPSDRQPLVGAGSNAVMQHCGSCAWCYFLPTLPMRRS